MAHAALISVATVAVEALVNFFTESKLTETTVIARAII